MASDTPLYRVHNESAQLLTTTVSYPNPGTAVCRAAGEVDSATAPLLHEQLHEALSDGPRHLVVDLSAVTFFSAAGLHALEEASTEQDEAHELVLVAKGRPVARVLDICDVPYSRYCDLDAALAACDEANSR